MACPAAPGSRSGNRVTADRWAGILRQLGHQVTIDQQFDGRLSDLLIALHARRSHEAIAQYRRLRPDNQVVVVLTGTDLYRDIHTQPLAQKSLEWADRLVVLQHCGRDELPTSLRSKVRVIYQSAVRTPRPPPKRANTFDVCVLGHLRREKDPFRTALALRLIPSESRLRVIHAGKSLSPAMTKRARALAEADSRYQWVGELSSGPARRLLAQSQILVLSSIMEGGANVISEALVDGVPVLASRIPGSIGLLGNGYPGFFPVGDTRELASLLVRAEQDAHFRADLTQWCRRRASEFNPAREKTAWKRLLCELEAERKGRQFAPPPSESTWNRGRSV